MWHLLSIMPTPLCWFICNSLNDRLVLNVGERLLTALCFGRLTWCRSSSASWSSPRRLCGSGWRRIPASISRSCCRKLLAVTNREHTLEQSIVAGLICQSLLHHLQSVQHSWSPGLKVKTNPTTVNKQQLSFSFVSLLVLKYFVKHSWNPGLGVVNLTTADEQQLSFTFVILLMLKYLVSLFFCNFFCVRVFLFFSCLCILDYSPLCVCVLYKTQTKWINSNCPLLLLYC